MIAFPFATLRTDALDNVFGFFNLETGRKGDGRNANVENRRDRFESEVTQRDNPPALRFYFTS